MRFYHRKVCVISSSNLFIFIAISLIFARPATAVDEAVYFYNFEGPVGNEWSHTQTDVTPEGNRRFLGQFFNDKVTLFLDDLPEHTYIRLSFDLFIIRSWDGNKSGDGPDIWSLTCDSELLLYTTFTNVNFPEYPEWRQSYPDTYSGGDNPPQSGADEINSLGYYYTYNDPNVDEQRADSVYNLESFFLHSGRTLTLDFTFSGSSWPEVDDESWGLDNVKVELYDMRTLTVLEPWPSPEDGTMLKPHPGEGTYVFFMDDEIIVEAVPSPPHRVFSHWSGDAVEAGKVLDPNASKTTVIMDGDYTLQAVFKEDYRWGTRLGHLNMDNDQENAGIATNNDQEDKELVTFGVSDTKPESDQVMKMTVVDGRAAQAKGRFGKCRVNRVLIRFEYLFQSSDEELVVYISESNAVGDHNALRTLEVDRISAPRSGQPGAVGSQQWASHEVWADVSGLDLSQGTYVELEFAPKGNQQNVPLQSLAGPLITMLKNGNTKTCEINDWGLQVHCDDTHCRDMVPHPPDQHVDYDDFFIAKAAYGRKTGLPSGSTASRCLEGAFCEDGYTDVYDLFSLDWIVENEGHLGHLCISLAPVSGTTAMTAHAVHLYAMTDTTAPDLKSATSDSGLMILGKGYAKMSYDDFIDHLYHLSANKAYPLPYDYSNMRLVYGTDNNVYILNSKNGLTDSAGNSLIPEESMTYNNMSIDLGVRWNRGEPVGLPLLDACVTAESIYVTPVLVAPPDGGVQYAASVRLSRNSRQIECIYHDSTWFDPHNLGNPYPYGLREVELDEAGNLYVLSVHALNDNSTMLWKYDHHGHVLAKASGAALGIDDPLALHYCQGDQALYVASGLVTTFNANDVYQAHIYQLKEESSQFVIKRQITIPGMQFVTSMTSDLEGSLWVAGFSFNGKIPETITEDNVSDILKDANSNTHYPKLAYITFNNDVVNVNSIDLGNGGTGEVGLPTSVIWIEK